MHYALDQENVKFRVAVSLLVLPDLYIYIYINIYIYIIYTYI